MAGTEVITGRMKDVAKNVEDITARYKQSVEKMYQIGAEIDAMWDGEASQKFMAKMGNDRVRFNAMTELLAKYVEVLRQDASVYEEHENKVIDVLNTNKIRTGRG